MQNSLKNIFLILFLFCIAFAYGQKTREQLEKEKKENIRKLEQTSKILQETANQKKASLGQLNALKQQEKIQKSIINNISSELKILNAEIHENQIFLDALNSDLDTLKKDYAKMIYEANKTSNSYNKLMFLFTSESFYELQMRINYLGQYTKARKNQVEQINKVAETIKDQLKVLNHKKTQQEQLLGIKVIEQKNLVSLEKQKEIVIHSLSEQEKELKKKLNQQRKDIAQLNKMIEDIVKKELEKNKSAGTGKLKLTPEENLLSNSFEGNKAHHIWPVAYGFVSQKFGKHWHPNVPGVEIDNIGIDIQTKKSEQVRCIFDGKVLAIASVPGMGKMVMVQHGEYFTVYTKIMNVFVTSGQLIKRKEPIGVAITNSEGVTEMQFQVWKNAEKLDPQLWIAK